MTDPLHKKLWNEHLETAQACLRDPFVAGLQDGSLSKEAFKRYIAQDEFFLRAFYSAYALASVKAVERPSVVRTLHDLMGGVLDELELHRGYATSLGIDLDNVEPGSATRAYTDFLLETTRSSDVGDILAAMTPCMRLYAWIGQQLALGDHTDNPYGNWIHAYAGAEFEELALTLELLLDELGEDRASVREAYGTAMRCELDFFANSR